MVDGLRFRVYDIWFIICGLGFNIWDEWLGVYGLGLMVWGLSFLTSRIMMRAP